MKTMLKEKLKIHLQHYNLVHKFNPMRQAMIVRAANNETIKNAQKKVETPGLP